MAKRRIPTSVYRGTFKQWQSKKRHEFREVVKAYEQFKFGCAFTPSYPRYVHRLEYAIDQIRTELSCRYWK